MARLEFDICAAAYELIKAMIKERDAMPRSFEAPKMVDAAEILMARLDDAGHVFYNDMNKTKDVSLARKNSDYL